MRLDPEKDCREQLRELGAWCPGTPLKLALFGSGPQVPNFINIEPATATNANSAGFSVDYEKMKFPALSVQEVLIQDGLSRYHPADAIAFLSNWVAWLAITARMTIRLPAGKWSYPCNQERYSWHYDALNAILDHFGLLIDYLNTSVVGGEEKITISAGRPERRSSIGSRYDLMQRLIEGPLCSFGFVPQHYTHEFYTRCLKYLHKEAPPDPTPNYRLRVPAVDPQRLQILHTVEFYAPRVGGAELVVKNLSERLVQRGHTVTIATSFVPERNFPELNGVHIEQFRVAGSTAIGISGSEVPHYMRYIREFPCDVMMNYAAQQWATDLVLPLLPRLKNRVNILAPCGYSAMSAPGKLRLNEFVNYYQITIPKALSAIDSAVYHSELYQDFACSKMMGLTNYVIIPNAVDESEFEQRPPVNLREKYGIKEQTLLLCVANFLVGKGQENLLEMLRELNDPNAALVFVGRSGPTLEKLRAAAQGLNAHFLVDIPREDTVAAFYSADLFVFTSELEASPLVILEAKAAGLPFVSTNVGNIKEWSGGVVCELSKMATQVRSLLNDSQRRAELAREGVREYREKHTWKSVADRYEELYLRLHHAKRAQFPRKAVAHS